MLMKINISVAPLILIVAYFFTNRLVKRKKHLFFDFIVILTGLLLSLTVVLSNLIVGLTNPGVYNILNNFWPFIYYGWMVAILLIVPLTIILRYRFLKRRQKNQVRYFVIGLIIVSLSNIFFNIILPFFKNASAYYKFGDYSTIFLLGFTAYAIIKHQMFNIKVIITEATVILLSIVLFAEIFLSNNITEGTLKAIIWVIATYGGWILIKSVQKEIKQREELQDLTQKLEKLNTKLKELDAMKTEFVSVASHELLTPISAIEGYLSIMLDEKMVKIDDPKAIEYLGNVYQSAKRLAKLVADLLNVSRIEQGRLLVEKTLIKMRNVISEVRTELKFKAQDAKLDLNVHIPKDVHTAVYADADKIKEVLVNLCGNSLKFTKAGGKVDVSAEIWSTHKLKEKYEHTIEELEQKEEVEGSLAHTVNRKASELLGDNQLVIWVKDTGMGISKEGLSKLFQKFSRVGTWSNHSVPGTGLGLYISKSLVEMHHGRIWAESEGEGKGSTFYFTLPLASAKKEVEEVDKEALPAAKDAKPLARTGLEGQIKSGSPAPSDEKTPVAPATVEASQPKTEPEPHPKTLAGEDLDEKPKINK
jgi:signal transduction histidine kinase